MGRLGDVDEFLGKELAGERAAREVLNQAERDLRNTVVEAPTSGVITSMQLAAGSFVRRGTPAITMIDTSRWWLIANYPENWLGKIRPGDKVMFSLRNYPGSMRNGTVASISRGVVQGQGVPDGTLADTASRGVRQSDTPQTGQRFQVIVNVADDVAGEPLRVGATGRVVVFAAGGLPVLNTLIIIITYIQSFMDYFFPKPSALLLLIIVGGSYWVWKRKSKLRAANSAL